MKHRSLFFILLIPLGLASVAPAQSAKPVAVRFWGQALVSIETYWNLTIVIDPYNPKIGYGDPGLRADLVLVTHEHFDHNNAKLIQGDPHVVAGLDSRGRVRDVNVVLDRAPNTDKTTLDPYQPTKPYSEHAIRVRSIASRHDDREGKQRGANAMFLVETNGVRILHCGDLGQTRLTDEQLNQIGRIDVLLIPIGGVYTIDGPQAAGIVDQLRPLMVVPIHYKLPELTIDLNTAEPFLNELSSSYQRTEAVGNTLAVSRGRRPGQKVRKVVVLKHKPYQPSAALRKLLHNKAKAANPAQALFTSLSINQLNHRPSNGTHTPRWNAEHVMASDLRLFSAIYARLDPMIPHINLNPRQMPPDYVPAHPDWTGAEEARQIERVLALVRRFAYLLDGIDLDEKPQGSPWTVQRLFEQITTHYAEHTANVKKKFSLPDWPKQ